MSGYRGEQAVALVDRFQERLRAIDGVEEVSTARMIPLQGSSLGLGRIRVAGYQGPRNDDTLDADWNVVSPGYLDVVGARLLEGRDFSAADRAGAPMVAIVNETFARAAWPGRPAVGQRFMQETSRDQEQPVEVVGVAADAKYRYFGDAPNALRVRADGAAAHGRRDALHQARGRTDDRRRRSAPPSRRSSRRCRLSSCNRSRMPPRSASSPRSSPRGRRAASARSASSSRRSASMG